MDTCTFLYEIFEQNDYVYKKKCLLDHYSLKTSTTTFQILLFSWSLVFECYAGIRFETKVNE